MVHKIPGPVTTKMIQGMEGSYKLTSYKISNRSNGSVQNDLQWVNKKIKNKKKT